MVENKAVKKFLDKKYRENLINAVREYISKFKGEMKNENSVVFYSYLNSTNSKYTKSKAIIKTVAIIWIIVIFVIALTITRREIITHLQFDINNNYVLIFLLMVIVLFVKALYSSKRIYKIILCDKHLRLYTASIFKRVKETHLKENSYLLSNIDFRVQSRRSTIKDNMRNNSAHFCVFDNKKMEKFLIKFKCEEEFFAFLLTLKNSMGKLNINSISDDELYNMYHMKSYGLHSYSKK